jgi:hypothetical protein
MPLLAFHDEGMPYLYGYIDKEGHSMDDGSVITMRLMVTHRDGKGDPGL